MSTTRKTASRPAVRRYSKLLWRRQYETFLKRLVLAREAAGLTQREAAKRLGRKHPYVAKCETGERRVDVVELTEFAKAYRKRLTFFLSFDVP